MMSLLLYFHFKYTYDILIVLKLLKSALVGASHDSLCICVLILYILVLLFHNCLAEQLAKQLEDREDELKTLKRRHISSSKVNKTWLFMNAFVVYLHLMILRVKLWSIKLASRNILSFNNLNSIPLILFIY